MKEKFTMDSIIENMDIQIDEQLRPTYKDKMFRALFSSKKEYAVELYNAIMHDNKPLDTPVVFVTLPDTFFDGQHNDLGILIDDKLVIFIEHQSTINRNMPLRLLIYTALTYYRLYYKGKERFKKYLIKLPTPIFRVVYNGKESLTEKDKQLKLSNAYKVITSAQKPQLDLDVEVTDIKDYHIAKTEEHQSKLLESYSRFVRVYETAVKNGCDSKQALKLATNDMEQSTDYDKRFIDFVEENRTNLDAMFYEEFNYDEFIEVRAEEEREFGREQGIEIGKEKGREEGIEIGKEKGIEIGKEELKIELIRKKFKNGKTIEQIANELEESTETITTLMQTYNISGISQ